MAYLTNADVSDWLGSATVIQLTDDAGTGSADEDRISDARQGAEGEANSYLATRYATPVSFTGETEVAAVLRAFVLDLAAYRLHGRRPPIPPDVVRRREEAIEWLARVASGLVQLPAIAAPREPTSLGVLADAAGGERTMTREALDHV